MTIKELQSSLNDHLNEIFNLRSAIENYKKEIEHLKSLLVASTPLLSTDTSLANEEFIALNELKKLKAKSEKEELTYEDAKRVELYFKVLKEIRNPKEKGMGTAKQYSTDELLSQVDSFANPSK